jgi:argininosuccinate lyase
MAMHMTPFSNSVSVATEGVKPLWNAIAEITEATELTRLAVGGAEPQADRMQRRAVEGMTFATALANRLVLEAGLSFRRAHHCVGEAVRVAHERCQPPAIMAGRLLRAHGLGEDASLDPAAVASHAAFGGGPAESSVRGVLAELRRRASDGARALTDRSRPWKSGRRALALAVAGL